MASLETLQCKMNDSIGRPNANYTLQHGTICFEPGVTYQGMRFSRFNLESGCKWSDADFFCFSYAPSQADVQLYKALGGPPRVGGLNHLRRWYRHIASFEGEFGMLSGILDADLKAYLPGAKRSSGEASQAPAQDTSVLPSAEAAEDDDDVDLFGSDEEEDQEAEKAREERLREYQERKAGKAKPAAKTTIMLDVKPWGKE